MHMRTELAQPQVTSGGRSTLTPCQNVETVLHNKSFLRAVATTYFSTPYVAHYSFQRARVLAISLHNYHDAET